MPLDVQWLGTVGYAEALELQAKCVEARRSGAAPDRLLLLEHPPVVTLGRSAKRANLRESPQALRARGVEVHEVARGGDVTYHGPGQLVGYAIADLAAHGEPDVHAHLRNLETSLAEAVQAVGIAPTTRAGYTGLFVAGESGGAHGPPRKIASIGVGVRHWVTLHGFALNVDLDLSGFGPIVPCGLHDVQMTSVARELRSEDPGLFTRVRAAVTDAFARRGL